MLTVPAAAPAMPLANAYPSPDLQAAQLAVMIVVPAGLLFVWLILVYLAARSGGGRARPARQPQAPPRGEIQSDAVPHAAEDAAALTEPTSRDPRARSTAVRKLTQQRCRSRHEREPTPGGNAPR